MTGFPNSLFDGTSFNDVAIATIGFLSSLILRVTIANDLWIAWFDVLTAKIRKLLCEILVLNASCSWRNPANRSVAWSTIWLSSFCNMSIPERIPCNIACWNCIADPTPETSESILTFSVCSRLSRIRIPFLSESNSSSRIPVSSFHACITWTSGRASSDNCCYTTSESASFINISPWLLSASSGSSWSLSSK